MDISAEAYRFVVQSMILTVDSMGMAEGARAFGSANIHNAPIR
jgi:hypothetical protein